MIELLVNKENNVKTIMLVENGVLVERHEEHENQKRLEGNIYVGKVENVLPGMQTAFVDIGEKKNTLLKAKDAIKQNSMNNEKEIDISDILKPGMEIMVQIKKDGTQIKGAKVSTHINLPGRFIALMPYADFVTVSQKIEDEKERERLIKCTKKFLPKDMGAVIRTSANNVKEEEIEKDIEGLLEEWKEIEKRYERKENILLYDNNALIRRTLIDILDRGLDRIIVNDKNIYSSVNEILTKLDKKIETVLKQEDLLNMYSLKEQVREMGYRKIWLDCGGFITIDKTEALTAIDVNTGKYVGKKNPEHTIFKVNKEATYEIAKQLRLRDIGGIIIIDYIDMASEKDKDDIQSILEKELKKDRTRCQVIGFTKLNLLEMTRKNMCNNDWDNEGEE